MNVRADDCSSVSDVTRARRQRVHGWAGTMQRCPTCVGNSEHARCQMCWGGPRQRFRSGQRLPCARPTVPLRTAKVQEWDSSVHERLFPFFKLKARVPACLLAGKTALKQGGYIQARNLALALSFASTAFFCMATGTQAVVAAHQHLFHRQGTRQW